MLTLAASPIMLHVPGLRLAAVGRGLDPQNAFQRSKVNTTRVVGLKREGGFLFVRNERMIARLQSVYLSIVSSSLSLFCVFRLI